MARLARCLLLAFALLPALLRRLPARPATPCAEQGRGVAPRRWLGCATDGGPARDLSGDERLLLGQPLDLNLATARDLGFVPGLTPSLAAAVVAEREGAGPFAAPEALVRVHGIGPKRLALARPFLVVRADSAGVAHARE